MSNDKNFDVDIVIIGAGIQGAAAAQAASAAGYSVQVLEQFNQAAVGTSSRSSKLIHGGLRYLETGQIGLVRECLRERKLLIKNAPHLVRLVPFHIPVYKQTTRSAWIILAGLMLYSLFSRKGFTRLAKKDWSTLDGLKTSQLKAVFRYYDAQTDDAKLTRAVLASAEFLGAEISYQANFQQANIQKDACMIAYQYAGEQKQIRSRCIINAAGPWVSETIKKMTPNIAAPEVDLVQGAHIEIPGTVARGMYYLEAPQDQRAVFVMPWKGHLLIGTTESTYHGDPKDVHALEDEIAYLLTVYNHYFKQAITPKEVINHFAGLRVLARAKNSAKNNDKNSKKGMGSAFSRPRDTVMVCDNKTMPKVVSLYGGKLTAHRATALEVMQLLSPSLPKRAGIADTQNLTLPTVD